MVPGQGAGDMHTRVSYVLMDSNILCAALIAAQDYTHECSLHCSRYFARFWREVDQVGKLRAPQGYHIPAVGELLAPPPQLAAQTLHVLTKKDQVHDEYAPVPSRNCGI